MYDTAAGHRRRREAALRLPPLESGRRDPLSFAEIADCVQRDHRDEQPPTDHELDGAKAAAEHLLAAGYAPLLRLDVIRALWRRRDRELAHELARIAGAA
jgi:hypothetical protein